MSGVSSRTLRSPIHCYCGEDLTRDKQKHNNGGGRHTGQCVKGRKCPLQGLGNGHWYVALAALKRMKPADRGERYPHLQLRETELLVNEHAKKRRRERCTSEKSTQHSALPTTTSHSSHTAGHREPLLNPRALVLAARAHSSHGASSSQAPSPNQVRPQGAMVLTPNTHSSQHANERKSSLTETFLINPLDEFEDWQQQGHSDTVGACEGDLSDSGSSRNGMLRHPPGLGLSSIGIGHARDLAAANTIRERRGRRRTRSSATVAPPP